MERPGFVLKEEVSVMFSGFFKTEKKKRLSVFWRHL